MIAQLQSGNSKLRKDFVNKFLTNNEKMETTGSKFENIAQILSSENIRSINS